MERVATCRKPGVALRDEDGERLRHDDDVLPEIGNLLLGQVVPYRAVGVVVNFELGVLGESERLGYGLHGDGNDLEAVTHLHHMAVVEHEGR